MTGITCSLTAQYCYQLNTQQHGSTFIFTFYGGSVLKATNFSRDNLCFTPAKIYESLLVTIMASAKIVLMLQKKSP